MAVHANVNSWQWCNEVSHENQDLKPTDGVHMNTVKEREKELQSWEVEFAITLDGYDHAE